MYDKKVGVFIDYENVNQLALIEEIFSYLQKKNYFSVKRKIIMSKLTNPESLTEAVKTNCLQVVVSYKKLRVAKNSESKKAENKNNADFRFYIEVMDCFYLDNPDGFVFAAGDKDYTELVLELKQRGKYLIGVGNRANTSEKYASLFDEFIYCEDLLSQIAVKQKELSMKFEKSKEVAHPKAEPEKKPKLKPAKSVKDDAAREEQKRLKEEQKRLEEERKQEKQNQEIRFLEEFKPLVQQFLDTHKPGKYLLTSITSEIKKKYPDKFPKRVKFDVYSKMNFDVKNETEDKTKAYLEIIEPETQS